MWAALVHYQITDKIWSMYGDEYTVSAYAAAFMKKSISIPTCGHLAKDMTLLPAVVTKPIKCGKPRARRFKSRGETLGSNTPVYKKRPRKPKASLNLPRMPRAVRLVPPRAPTPPRTERTESGACAMTTDKITRR